MYKWLPIQTHTSLLVVTLYLSNIDIKKPCQTLFIEYVFSMFLTFTFKYSIPFLPTHGNISRFVLSPSVKIGRIRFVENTEFNSDRLARIVLATAVTDTGRNSPGVARSYCPAATADQRRLGPSFNRSRRGVIYSHFIIDDIIVARATLSERHRNDM